MEAVFRLLLLLLPTCCSPLALFEASHCFTMLRGGSVIILSMLLGNDGLYTRGLSWPKKCASGFAESKGQSLNQGRWCGPEILATDNFFSSSPEHELHPAEFISLRVVATGLDHSSPAHCDMAMQIVDGLSPLTFEVLSTLSTSHLWCCFYQTWGMESAVRSLDITRPFRIPEKFLSILDLKLQWH